MGVNAYRKAHRLVATWISEKDFDLLKRLATTNRVRLSAYVRAILIDALQEEEQAVSDSIKAE